jgi:hypothetical protein
MPGDVSDFGIWAANEVGRIIQGAADWHLSSEWSAARSMRALCARNNIADAAAFARFIGTSKGTTWYWLNGKARPSLPMALRTYYQFGASLADEITGGHKEQPEAIERQMEIHLRPSKTRRKRDWSRIKRQLRTELSRSCGKTRAVTEIASAHGVAVRTLREHFPKLCRQLAKKHRAATLKEVNHRRLTEENEIANAVRSLASEGVEISQRTLAAHLGKQGLFCRPEARRAFQNACRQPICQR